VPEKKKAQRTHGKKNLEKENALFKIQLQEDVGSRMDEMKWSRGYVLPVVTRKTHVQ